MHDTLHRVVIALILVAALLVHPNESRAAPVISPQFTIQQFVHAYDLHTVYVKNNIPNFTGVCGCTNCNYFVLRDTTTAAEDFKTKMPFLLAAFMGGKVVSVQYDNSGGGNCYSGYPLMYVIYVEGP